MKPGDLVLGKCRKRPSPPQPRHGVVIRVVDSRMFAQDEKIIEVLFYGEVTPTKSLASNLTKVNL